MTSRHCRDLTAPKPTHRNGTQIKLGAFLDNTRRRADRLSAERRADLDALGMRW
jgi:hypothetical protein